MPVNVPMLYLGGALMCGMIAAVPVLLAAFSTYGSRKGFVVATLCLLLIGALWPICIAGGVMYFLWLFVAGCIEWVHDIVSPTSTP